MGVTLGWVALALTALGVAPQSEREKPPITYTVRMIEADGVCCARLSLPLSSQSRRRDRPRYGLCP